MAFRLSKGVDLKENGLRSLELFTGAGGLALGTHHGGFRHAALVEWNRDACATLRLNARERSVPGITHWKVIEGDVRQLAYEHFGEVDLVAGGPPCQPFSIGGKHRGMRDDRDMIPEFVRAIRRLQPRAFLFENVKGLTRTAFRDYFSYLQLQLAHPDYEKRPESSWEAHLAGLRGIDTCRATNGIRYEIATGVLNAADFGVPQVRHRVFIVGFRSDLGVKWRFPAPTHSLSRLLYDQWISGQYWEHRRMAPPSGPPTRFRAAVRRLDGFFPPRGKAWVPLRDAIEDLPEPDARPGTCKLFNHAYQPGARAYPGHTGSPLDLPAKTLKAGVHGVPGGENMIVFPDESVRYLTVREAARVQTFPDAWRFSGAWSETMRQLGNAVPVKLAALLARSIATSLEGFGLHDPGSGRREGERSWWDTLHPGRRWAEKQRGTRSTTDALDRLGGFLEALPH